jgi:hypothetical protein
MAKALLLGADSLGEDSYARLLSAAFFYSETGQ